MGLELNYKDGQTPLNADEKEGLKIKSITTQKELDEFEQLNLEKAVEWTIRTKLKQERVLTEKFIKDLHKKMYGDVWKWAGNFRTSEKNIGITWTSISTYLKALLDDANYWVDNHIYAPEEIAIRFKHRLVAIHCFPNGNGRHSRLMADIIMESVIEQDIFSWHSSNMVKADDVRKAYILALKKADGGNIDPLIEFAKT
ncbi:mobile mystery protein B [Winogradskyella sp.]|nr:mobile mystery protein B [Winogradskyella sp.]